MNPVLMLTRNNLALTKRAVESVYCQRLHGVAAFFWDNGSTDGTVAFLDGNFSYSGSPYNKGVSHGWNRGLEWLFDIQGYEYALVLNNDVVLPHWFYSNLLSFEVPFVTGVAVDDMEATKTFPERLPLTQNPDFSAFLIRREVWKKVGPFNERLVSYAGDCDFHVRAHRMGIPLWKSNTPYYHERSSTLKNASPQEHRLLCAQADADRGTFKAMYGCLPGDVDYEKLFLPVETR